MILRIAGAPRHSVTGAITDRAIERGIKGTDGVDPIGRWCAEELLRAGERRLGRVHRHDLLVCLGAIAGADLVIRVDDGLIRL